MYEEVKADARQRLGRLFNAADYPTEVRGLFAVAWDFPSVEPPSYLMRVAPEVVEEEREKREAALARKAKLLEALERLKQAS